MNLLEILKFAEEYLRKYSFSKSRLESEKLVATVLKLDRLALYVNFDRELLEEEKADIKKYLLEMAKTGRPFDEIKEEYMYKIKDYKEENLDMLNKSIAYLEKFSVPNAKLDAEYIFSEVLSLNRTMLSLNLTREIKEEEKEKIKEMLVMRAKYRKPLQYIFGKWEFYGYEFKLDERVLIPRSDTEILVEQCKFLMQDRKSQNILDIGTGSGAIAISLAKELKDSIVKAVDISDGALELANSNKELNSAANVTFLKSDVFSAVVGEKFDLIVSNPPYIPVEEYKELMPEVLKFEPKNALTDNGDGYFFYEKISKEAHKFLEDDGYLAFEVGYNQAKKVSELMEENYLDVVCIVKDYAGIDRVVIAKKSGDR